MGVYGAKIKLRGDTQGQATVDGELITWEDSARWRESRHAPGLGLSMAYRPADRWELRAQAQGFKTSWGDFDTDGHFMNASAEVGYRFNRNWTVFGGYDWFKLKLEDDVAINATVDGTSYSVSGPGSAQLKVHGPTVGLRASF